MNLELNDAGMTFLVGSFVILTAEALGYYILGRDLFRFFQGQVGFSNADGAPAAVTAGVFVGLSFALGLLVEDVCHKYDDANVDWPFTFAYGTLHLAADDHDDTNLKAALHHAVLVTKLRPVKPELTGLGSAVFGSGIFEALLGPARGGVVRRWAFAGGPLPPGTQANPYDGFRRDLDAIFYFAKNRIYLQKNYFDELSRIQLRVDFARTMATTSLVSSMLGVLLGLIALAKVWKDKNFRRHVARRTVLVTLAFGTIYVLAYHAFVRESKEFNKRVYGYYDSMLRARGAIESRSGVSLP